MTVRKLWVVCENTETMVIIYMIFCQIFYEDTNYSFAGSETLSPGPPNIYLNGQKMVLNLFGMVNDDFHVPHKNRLKRINTFSKRSLLRKFSRDVLDPFQNLGGRGVQQQNFNLTNTSPRKNKEYNLTWTVHMISLVY